MTLLIVNLVLLIIAVVVAGKVIPEQLKITRNGIKNSVNSGVAPIKVPVINTEKHHKKA